MRKRLCQVLCASTCLRVQKSDFLEKESGSGAPSALRRRTARSTRTSLGKSGGEEGRSLTNAAYPVPATAGPCRSLRCFACQPSRPCGRCSSAGGAGHPGWKVSKENLVSHLPPASPAATGGVSCAVCWPRQPAALVPLGWGLFGSEGTKTAVLKIECEKCRCVNGERSYRE